MGGFLLFNAAASFGQCNPSGNVSRYEFNVDPSMTFNLTGQQFCTSLSQSNNCCGQQSDYRCLDLVFNLNAGPQGEPFTDNCNGTADFMTGQGSFDALFFNIGAPNPAGNATNCAAPIGLGNNYTISTTFTGNNLGQLEVNLSVKNNLGVVVFSSSQTATSGESVIFTLGKLSSGCVEGDIVFGCCSISSALALGQNAPSTICDGDATTLKVTGTGGTAPYVATFKAENAGNISYFTVTINDDLDGNPAMDMTTFQVTPTATTTYTLLSIEDASDCVQPADDQLVTITVNPKPQVDPVANQTYCAGNSVPSVVFTSDVPGATFSWSRTNEAIGLGSNSGTGNVPTFTATNAGTTPITATFSVVASFTSNGATCTGTPIQFAITINPNPQVNTVPNQTYCTDVTVPSVILTGNVPGAVYTWSRTNEAIGLATNSGTGDIPSFTATNAGATPLTATFSVVATFTNNGSTCTGTPKQFTITINPTPQVNAVANQTHCAGASVPAVVFTSSVPGATYSWSRTNEAIGLAINSDTGNVPSFTATNAGTTPITATFSVVASFTNNGTTCTGTPIQFTLSINPTPQASPVSNKAYCVGASVPSIVFTSNVPDATFSWSRTNEAIGLGTNSGIGDLPAFTAANAGNTPLTATFSVVASYSSNGVNCSGTPIQFTITVYPTPNAVATPASQTICSGNAITTIVLSGNVTGTAFNWVRDNTLAVTGIPASGTGNISGALTNTTNNPLTVTFSITPTATNCPGTPVNATVLVNPVPALFAVTGGGTVCTTDNIGVPVGLSGSQVNVNYQLRLNGNPLGAPVAGTGAPISFGGQLSVGTYTVVATHALGGCTMSMTGTATVATLNCTVAITDPCVCKNNATTLLNGQFDETIKVNAPGTQTWTVSAINGLFSSNSLAPPSAPVAIPLNTPMTNLGVGMNMFQLLGIHVDALGYTITVTNGMGTSLTIGNSCAYPNPEITSDLSGAFCLFSNPVNLTGIPGDNNIISQGFTINGVPATQFNPGQGVGNYVIEYTVDGGAPKAFGNTDPGCIQKVSTTVHVVATPSVLVCNNLINVSLPASCQGEIMPDDVLEGTYGCYDDYGVTLDRTLPLGNGPWTSGLLDGNDIGHTYQVRVTHLVSGNYCWGLVKIEDKLPPTLVCENFSIPCNTPNLTPAYLNSVLGITAATPQVTDCQTFTLNYFDTEVTQNCASGLTKIITRKWVATDASNNSATCNQIISLTRPTLADVVPPPNYDDFDAPSFHCTDHTYPTPQWIESQGLQGFPWVFGFPTGCTINWGFEDLLIPVCDGTYKISRKWTIIDWCTGTSITRNQIIKVLDNQGPTMTCPADLTVSVNPSQCCATTNLPDVIIRDACSRIGSIGGMIVTFEQYTGQQTGMYPIGGTLTDFPGNNHWDPDTLGAYGWTPCLPVGTHTVTYSASDDCTNTTTCTFHLTVLDDVPPVAACDQTTVVSIGVDDPFDCYGPVGPNGSPAALGDCAFGGVTWVKATTFNDGSYDQCNNVKFTIRRMPPYSDCILGLNSTNGHPSCSDAFPDNPSEFERAIAESDSIKFYCCEVGTTQTVILRVYQVDVNGNLSIGYDGEPIYNECMIQVSVQDKLKPVCVSPPNVTVTCDVFDPSLWSYGKPTVYDNCCLDDTKVYQGQCGLTHSVSYTQFDTICNKGTITRTFRAFDCHGQSGQCTQRVVVNYKQDYYVRFPNDVIVTTCNGAGVYGEPTFFGKDCELLGVTYHDDIFTVVPDACFKIERSWKIINWCTYDPNAGCVYVPNPNPNAISNHPSNLPGPIVSPIQTTGDPWKSTIVKISPSDPVATNYSIYYNPNANCYTYKQIIKIVDTQDPEVTCPASPVTICDLTANDAQLWNESYWWNNGVQSHDLCEAPADICVTATDACSGANINIEYQLFLDLDGDGVMETIVNSTQLGSQPGGLGWNNVLFGNATGAGVSRQFDERPVPANQKWGFAIQETTSGANKTACVKFNTSQAQNTFVDPQLPYGTHKIKWFVTDGCGNVKVCEYTIIIKDCKPPTVVCLNGLSVNIMPTGMIQLWATDFLQYAEDNCTPTPYLKYAIRKCGQGTGFPVDASGSPITSVTFTCDELGTQCVELWAIDLAGNADFCQTYVIVQDNVGTCGPSNHINVSGVLKTELLDGIEHGEVDITGSLNFAPPFSYFGMTDSTGSYAVNNAVPMASAVTISPVKDEDPLNGITTYDLVLISKHILGIEALTSPYKMIAADANKSGSITTFDIVEIRKLILGIYQEFPHNTSWRFMDKTHVFTNQMNPFVDTIPEFIATGQAMSNMVDEDFIGIKIGDVNNSALANNLMVPDDRSVGTLIFDVKSTTPALSGGEGVRAGQEFELTFTADQKTQGFQMTLNLQGLEVVDIVGNDKVTANNFGVLGDALTVSIDGADAFTVKFRAMKAGKLSEMLAVSSRITKAEGYVPVEALAKAGEVRNADFGVRNTERLDVALRFDGKTIAGVGFELYQNQPNPFVNKTYVGFHLPEAAAATLTVYDETGRVVFRQKGDFAKGYNAILLDRALLNTTGLMYYTLETATDAGTKKMIQAK